MLRRFLASALILFALAIPASAQFSGSGIRVTERDTAQTLPAGLWGMHVTTSAGFDTFTIERNTAAGNNFSTLTTAFKASNGVVSFPDYTVTLGTVTSGLWNATKIGLAYGGTNADLSATGGTSQVLKQAGSGAAVTVGQLACADLSNAGAGCSGAAGLFSGSVTANQIVIATAANTLGSAASVNAASGGTGQTSYAVGDLLYADTTTTLAKRADVATGSVLASGGVNTAPAYSSSPTIGTSVTTPFINLSATSGQIVFNSGGSSGTLSWTPSASAKTITLPNGTTDFTATGGTSQVVKQVSSGAAFTVAQLACADLSDAGTGCSSGAATISGSGTSTQVTFFSGASTITSDADMTFATDTLTVTKLGVTTSAVIGTSTSSGALNIVGTTTINANGSTSGLNSKSSTGGAQILFTPTGADQYSTGAGVVNGNDWGVTNVTRSVSPLQISGGASGPGKIYMPNLSTAASSGTALCLTATEVIAVTTSCATSGAQYKDKITYDVVPGLSLVLNMKPARFLLRQAPELGERYGFIAQDADKLEQRLVRYAEFTDQINEPMRPGKTTSPGNGTPNSFDYEAYTANLTVAIQEHETHLVSSDSRIEELEKEVAELKSKLGIN